MIYDLDLDWEVALKIKGANPAHKEQWEHFCPTMNGTQCLNLINEYHIDVRYYNPEYYPDLEHPWMGALQRKTEKGLTRYTTAFGPTAQIAAMRALVKSFS